MMEVGFTALSVEMLTKTSTACSSASSARFAVPKTLLRIASSGFSSISGTCLCAAAWKTTCGRKRSKTRVSRSRLRTSATTVVNGRVIFFAHSSCSIWKRLFSPLPSSTRRAGSKGSICRTISDPMEPPAPVIRTVLPRM